MIENFLRHLEQFYDSKINRRNFLYKYYSLRKDSHKVNLERIVRVIAHQELYFSSSINLNDPLECRPIYIAPKKDFKAWIKSKKKESRYSKNVIDITEKRFKSGLANEKQMCNHLKEKMYKRIQEEIGICCFSVIPDNMLMWAHYASSHTGICFQFTGTPFTNFFGEAQKVCYKRKRSVVNVFDNNHYRQVKATFLTKNKDWKYEREFRMVGYWRKPGIRKFPKNYLKGIILGAKISKEDEDFLINFIKKSETKVELYKVSLNEKCDKLNIIPA